VKLLAGTTLLDKAFWVSLVVKGLHGAVKIVLVWALLRDRLWAYPWMIGFLLVFIAYQCYLLVLAFSWPLALLTAFDALVVWLTWREYGIHRGRRERRRTAEMSDF